MAGKRVLRNGQKSGQADAPLGYTWADYVAALIAEHGSLAQVAQKLVDRGQGDDPASVEKALRRLRARGQHDGGVAGARVLRVFGVPHEVEARIRWMGLYHSRFGDLPVAACVDQLRLWDRPPISESKARAYILLGLASVALRRRSFDEARVLLDKAGAGARSHTIEIERELAIAYLATRLDLDIGRAALVAAPHLAAAQALLDESREVDTTDAACFRARLVDHAAYEANRRGDHDAALALYRGLPEEDLHPFASYRRDAGIAYGLHRRGDRDEALRIAWRACEHAGDGGYVRLRVMGLLMVARIQPAAENASTLDRAATIAIRLDDPELMIRVERARQRP